MNRQRHGTSNPGQPPERFSSPRLHPANQKPPMTAEEARADNRRHERHKRWGREHRAEIATEENSDELS